MEKESHSDSELVNDVCWAECEISALVCAALFLCYVRSICNRVKGSKQATRRARD